MTTIEERAENYAKKRDEFGDVDIPDVEVMSDIECEDYLRETYIEIATEQEAVTKQEMIEKACKWMKRELADPMPDELYQQWCDDKLEDFRKAMEE